MMTASIWDLDQTLFDCRHRLHHILGDEPDWEAFHAKTLEDGVIQGAVETFKAMAQRIVPFVCTSRPEDNRDLTERQLRQAGIRLQSRAILMRGLGDFRRSVEIKRDMVYRIRARGYNPVVAFEDQPAVVQMYRQEGIVCWAADDTEWKTHAFKEAKHGG